VQGIDVFPTLARLLGVPPPPGLPGRDLLAGGTPRTAVLETSRGIGLDGARLDLVAVRTARWKLVEAPGVARRELYDLANDPGEHAARTASGPEIAELGAALERWRAATRPAAAAPAAAGLGERLRALGYTQ
jgi:arylsulfatase A-like enzyme